MTNELKAVKIDDELEQLVFLEGRTMQTPPEAEEGVFATLFPYDENGGVYAGGFSGESPWERHGAGDELVHVLKGAARLTVLTADRSVELELSAGMVFVVPRGLWHRFEAPDGVTVMTMTPGTTEHSTAADPRKR